MDQIQSMRVFLRVVEAGTFTRAAASLNMPKGTVTKLVQHLESRLRVKLLHRTTRRVTVTPDGAAYYERTARLLNELDDIEATITNARATPSGRLRVDVPAAVAHAILVPRLPSFHARYPDIQLDLGVSDRTVDLIEENVDCVLRGGTLLDESLVARRVATAEFVTVASAEYLRRNGTPGHPLEIEEKHKAVSLFSPRSGRFYPQHYFQGDTHHELSPPYIVSVNESSAQLNATLAGMGITQMLRFYARPDLESGRLVQVLPEWTRPPMPAYVVYPPNRHLNARVRAFVDWTTELFAPFNERA
jgi:LysR family transcriptional regulator, regulator for bpeEF and oprC